MDFLKELFGSGEDQDLQANCFPATGSGSLQSSHPANDRKIPPYGITGSDGNKYCTKLAWGD